MSINIWDISVSMLLSFLLANIRLLPCFFFFFFFLVVLSSFFIIPAVREKKVRFALAMPTSAPATLVNEIIDTPPLVALKAMKAWSI